MPCGSGATKPDLCPLHLPMLLMPKPYHNVHKMLPKLVPLPVQQHLREPPELPNLYLRQ